MVDGPLAPFGDADQLRSLIVSDASHRALYEVFLKVRDSAAKILESTSVADLIGRANKPSRSKKKRKGGALLAIIGKGDKGAASGSKMK